VFLSLVVAIALRFRRTCRSSVVSTGTGLHRIRITTRLATYLIYSPTSSPISRLRIVAEQYISHRLIVWTFLFRKNLVCSPLRQFQRHTTNFVCLKFKIKFSTEPFTTWSLPRERLSNLASSFENTPPGGRICTGMRGLSKQHDKKHDINNKTYGWTKSSSIL
jgi:hypothetical protein